MTSHYMTTHHTTPPHTTTPHHISQHYITPHHITSHHIRPHHHNTSRRTTSHCSTAHHMRIKFTFTRKLLAGGEMLEAALTAFPGVENVECYIIPRQEIRHGYNKTVYIPQQSRYYNTLPQVDTSSKLREKILLQELLY